MQCDIIIPVWNKKDLTKRCIENIVKNTRCPYKLIIIDNASDSPTKDYLESLKENEELEIKLIRNEENLGNTKAVNQGIKASDAPFVCILDNDTVVCDGWLHEMIAVANSDKSIGIVNPSSNTLGVSPKSNSQEGIEKCAEECKEFRGQKVEIGACVGFCSLVKREVIEKIGGWDEAFSPGYFDDTEYSYRAYKAGHKSVCAKAAYVYHNEHSSFKDTNLRELFKEKRQLYYEKVGKPKRILYVLTKKNIALHNKIKEKSYKLASEINWVMIYIKSSLPDLKMTKHGRIGISQITSFLFRLRCIFRILVKKKKYTNVYVDDNILYNLLRKLTKFHKAEVELIKENE